MAKEPPKKLSEQLFNKLPRKSFGNTPRLLAKSLSPLLITGCLAANFWILTAAAQPLNFLSSLKTPSFKEFDQYNFQAGSLKIVPKKSYQGKYAIYASYLGGAGNGYARVIKNLHWQNSKDIWYGAAFYLPKNYLKNLQGGNDIMRWDNYGNYQDNADYGGVELWSDGKARLLLGKYTNDPGRVLTKAFKLPEGRWF